MALLFRVGLLLMCLYGSRVAGYIHADPADVTNATTTILTCNHTNATEVKGHHWAKNGKVIDSTSKDSSASYIEYKLDKMDPNARGGVYTCVFRFANHNESKTIEIRTKPHVAAYKHSEHGNENDKAVLVCVSHGYPLPTDWEWFKVVLSKREPIANNSEKYEVRNAPNKTTLNILDLNMEADAASYVCVGRNDLGAMEDTIQLRVRSRLAALWPFLGIVAEVVILITVIFIYEKRRKPDEISDDDDSGAAPLKGDVASNHTDKNIRQRNSN